MANTFKSYGVNLGTAPSTIYTTQANTTTIVISLLLCNITAAPALQPVNVTVKLNKSNISTQICSNMLVPPGTTGVALGEVAKLALMPGDTITGFCSVNGSIDATISIMEIT